MLHRRILRLHVSLNHQRNKENGRKYKQYPFRMQSSTDVNGPVRLLHVISSSMAEVLTIIAAQQNPTMHHPLNQNILLFLCH